MTTIKYSYKIYKKYKKLLLEYIVLFQNIQPNYITNSAKFWGITLSKLYFNAVWTKISTILNNTIFLFAKKELFLLQYYLYIAKHKLAKNLTI
jgi:hypothetical protein